MAENSSIEWCDHTFNPWEGCQKVSPGCDNCYAEARNKRFGKGMAINWGPGATRRRTTEDNWGKPLRWNAGAADFLTLHNRRQRVFCASLADWLDNEVPIQWLVELLEVVRTTPDMDWLLLSKRIGNWAGRISEAIGFLDEQTPAAHPLPLRSWLCHWLDGDEAPRNVWLGATVVNQAEVDRDVPKLLRAPAAVRFLSVEPMLGPLDLTWCKGEPFKDVTGKTHHHAFNALGSHGTGGINWVIVGGESGPKARPMHPDWARRLRDQCAAAGVPFLFKQWGEWREFDDSGLPGVRTIHEGDPEWDDQANKCDAFMAHDGELIADIDHGRDGMGYRGLERIGKKAAGRQLDGRTHDEFPYA